RSGAWGDLRGGDFDFEDLRILSIHEGNVTEVVGQIRSYPCEFFWKVIHNFGSHFLREKAQEWVGGGEKVNRSKRRERRNRRRTAEYGNTRKGFNLRERKDRKRAEITENQRGELKREWNQEGLAGPLRQKSLLPGASRGPLFLSFLPNPMAPF